MDTRLFDKNGTPIKVGDRTRLILDDGEVREFEVCFKTVNRTTVKTLPGFEPETAEVSITGIFFLLGGARSVTLCRRKRCFRCIENGSYCR